MESAKVVAGPPDDAATMRTVLLCGLALGLLALDHGTLDRRIADLRMADLALRLPAAGSGPVTWRLHRHAFPFGTAIAAAPLGLGDQPLPVEDVARYREILTRHFTAVVCENEMKWSGMERADGSRRDDRALAMLDFAEANDLFLRGHCVLWGVPRWLPDWQKDLPPADAEARVRARFAHVLTLFGDRIPEWDLVNELMAEDIFAAKMGWDTPDCYFAWARELSPGTRFFINEFKGLQDGTPEKVVAFAESLRERGVVVDGIGDQAHFFRPVPDAQTLWDQLDVYHRCGIPLVITEFDLSYKGMTEADRAEQIERMLAVCFAHPAVHGFYLWGFWDGRHWRKNCGLWSADWTPKPAAEAWMRCLHQRWTTTGEGQAEAGVLRWRGFPGTYAVTWQGEERLIRIAAGTEALW